MSESRAQVIDIDILEYAIDPRLHAHRLLTQVRRECDREGLIVTESYGVTVTYTRNVNGQPVACMYEQAERARLVAQVEVDR